jgi:hypothetical protein
VGESQFRRGDGYSGTLSIYVLCGIQKINLFLFLCMFPEGWKLGEYLQGERQASQISHLYVIGLLETLH